MAEAAARYGFSNASLESDSSLGVNMVINKQSGAAPIFLILDDFTRLSFFFFNLLLCKHVRRAGNVVARLVARSGNIDNSELFFLSVMHQVTVKQPLMYLRKKSTGQGQKVKKER